MFFLGLGLMAFGRHGLSIEEVEDQALGILPKATQQSKDEVIMVMVG
jgi:hypothetical protein